MTTESFGQLGLPSTATAEQVRAARRQLAKEHHPDAGGDAERMQMINNAAAAALRAIASPVLSPAVVADEGDSSDDGADHAAAGAADWSGHARDVPSFTVEALPVETFEALLVVTTWLGEVLDDDPPYRLDTHLFTPTPCWCRLELVPDAGASTVSITVATNDGTPPPSVEAVRDLWVENLNAYDWT